MLAHLCLYFHKLRAADNTINKCAQFQCNPSSITPSKSPWKMGLFNPAMRGSSESFHKELCYRPPENAHRIPCFRTTSGNISGKAYTCTYFCYSVLLIWADTWDITSIWFYMISIHNDSWPFPWYNEYNSRRWQYLGDLAWRWKEHTDEKPRYHVEIFLF